MNAATLSIASSSALGSVDEERVSCTAIATVSLVEGAGVGGLVVGKGVGAREGKVLGVLVD